jgi:two-component system CheB/CheR fusion protein
LEALTSFFEAMPPDEGIGFVLVVHLDPQHVSMLPELLQKKTSMPVAQATDGVTVAANHVYIIPPNRNLAIHNGKLRLLEIVKVRGVNMAIDHFLKDLALDRGREAVGIILSGTGMDGTLGIRAINDACGFVMAQDPPSAGFDGMPRSAIATGVVDYVLVPAEMPAQLVRCVRESGLLDRSPDESMLGALGRIYAVLRSRTSHDFSHYKTTTVSRRIERRMTIHQIAKVEDYVRLLQKSEREIDILFKELLIGVTSFFRDAEAYVALGDKVLPGVLAGMPDGAMIRAWVPGCATGEEAYSLAILLCEVCERLHRPFHVQVFGTDLNEDAIAKARAGVYPEDVLTDLGQQRIDRFFSQGADGRYRIVKEVREKMIFAAQNLIEDSPFTNLTLLSCRNLLIYLDGEIQRQLLPMFHYCLAPQGILFLGSSETIGGSNDLFECVDRKWKIFRRRPVIVAGQIQEFPGRQPDGEPFAARARPVRRAEELSALQLVESILRQSDTPPCVVVNTRHEIIFVHGRIGKFLEPAAGRMSTNVLRMALPGLKLELAAGLKAAMEDRRDVITSGLRVDSRDGEAWLDLTVRRLPGRGTMQDLLMVIFQETTAPEADGTTSPIANRAATTDLSAAELEQELRDTRENLQSTIEELETANEELKSTNEELQSTNEELQSTNEELETSKEELQSMNEEAITINQELQTRAAELLIANDDLVNLLDSTEIATIFLDNKLCVRRFTPRATEIVPLTAADCGRAIDHFASRLRDVDLAAQGRLALDDLATHSCYAESRKGHQYMVRTRPYRTLANVIDGVVITFDDVTEFRRLESLKRLAVVVRDSNDAITLLDDQGYFVAWNRGAERMYGYLEAEALRLSIADIVPVENRSGMLALVTGAFAGEEITAQAGRRIGKGGRAMEVWLTATLIPAQKGQPALLATTEREIRPGAVHDDSGSAER